MAKQSPSQKTGFGGLSRVKYVIAIASGKGGVGKSTVSTNLAIALQQTGSRVGLMDADIYGPSQPGMLGSKGDRPNVQGEVLLPISRHGIDFISMGLLVGDDTPVIWRAPIAMKMIHQFIGSVAWGDLDYVLIDLPPGTGDVQLTLAQQASLSGAIIVTTPQQVALGVARKGLRMFDQVKVPIVGIIENMSGFTCKHCGKETAIFKEGGGKQMAAGLGVPFLGSIPLDPEIMMSGDDGIPVFYQNPESPASKAFIDLAESVRVQMKQLEEQIGEEPQDIRMEGDNLVIDWPADKSTVHTPYHLRVNCPCATCVDEDSGERLLDPKTVPLDIKVTGVNPVGRYGLAIQFSDGHNTGIYTFQRLAELDEGGNKESKDAFSV